MLQGIQADIPEFAVMFEPCRRVAQRRRVKPAVMLAAHDLALEEARPFEHQNVFRNGVQRNRERRSDFGDSGRLARQPCQNGAPRGVGNG